MTYCTCGHIEGSHGPRGCYLACKCAAFAGIEPGTLVDGRGLPSRYVTDTYNANSPRALTARLRDALTNRELASKRADAELLRVVEEVIGALDE